jgi:hypothetical protein
VALFLFNKELSPPPFGPPDNQEFVLDLGATTIVYLTSTQSLTFVGLAATGGNVNGMVVVFLSQNVGTLTLDFAHDSNLASAPTRRFVNAGQQPVTLGPGGAVMHRFNGVTGRWHQLGRA